MERIERRSITFTILILAGVVIALLGVLLIALGLGGSTAFDLSLGDEFEVSTTSTGLAVLVVGAGLSALVALNLPDNVQVFAPREKSLLERLEGLRLPFVVLAVAALVLFVISLVVT